jgi:hypothetical protein
MRIIQIMSSLAIFVLLFGPCAWAKTPDDSDISFSVPFACYMEEPYCLVDKFKAGLKIVMVSKSGICSARTGEAFKYEHHVEDFEATSVVGTEPCPVFKDETPFAEYYIAVVGADPSAVRPVALKDDKSSVPKEMELQARKLSTPKMKGPQRLSDMSHVPVGLTDAPPRVLRAENITLLIFELMADGEPWESGPTVIAKGGQVYLLEGECTYGEPKFFFVNERLYVMYNATVECCGCGNSHSFVYDLSADTPEMVYVNSSFSD